MTKWLLVVLAVAACNGGGGGAQPDGGGKGDGGGSGSANGDAPPPGCGDGIMSATEECDDGNLVDGDGCDHNCKPSACGNGITGGAETCDDGNTVDGDGCDAECRVEPGYTCSGTACTTTCGDGIAAGTEECDDANATSGDGCDNCVLEAGCASGQVAVVVSSDATMTIPDDDLAVGAKSPVSVTQTGAVGKVSVIIDRIHHDWVGDVQLFLVGPNNARRRLAADLGAGAHDYAQTWFRDDAPSSIDFATAPFTGMFTPEQSLSTAAGTDFKGTRAAGTWTLQAYDDDGGIQGELRGWTLVACVAPGGFCGDGHVDAGEECDDGNSIDTDACKSTCKKPCGDGIQDAGESCDDGNHVSGDGCSATCQIESGCPAGSTLVSGVNNTALAIADDGTFHDSTIALTTLGAVTRVYATIASLTATTDVLGYQILLTSPLGTSRTLVTSDGFGFNANPAFTNTRFADAGTVLIENGTSPFTGTFKPDESLSLDTNADFLKHTSKGTWTLSIAPSGFGDNPGTLSGWSLAVCVDTTSGFCGDGIVQAGEQCDDGNTSNTDACLTTCKFKCGDGVVEAGEQCDDGNRVSADGCSATCQFDCPTGSSLVSVSNNTSVAIPDNTPAGASSSVTLASAGKIASLRVNIVKLTHTYVADLTLSLIGPTSLARQLVAANTVTAAEQNFANTIFSDASTAAISDPSLLGPFTGSWKPAQTLSTTAGTDFKGATAAGTWTLHAVDVAMPDSGTIDMWTLSACVTP